MSFKILAAVGLILLGLVVYSVYSEPINKSEQDDGDVIKKTEASNRTCEIGIFEKVEIDSNLIEAPESCEDFENIIVNPALFRELASNGTVKLTLMGEDYELKLEERETGKTYVTSYMGYIVGKPQSSTFFTVRNDSVEGCINVDFYTLSYGIASTEEKYNGKFKQMYTMKPGDEIFSPEIKVESGYYRYKIILDNKSTFEQRVTANYAANLGGSEKLHLTIRDDSDNPIQFVGEIS